MKPPLPAAVVFDLDGTLAETHYDIAATTDHVLASLGLPPVGPDRIRDYLGRGIENLLRGALGPGHDDLVGQGLALYLEHHRAECTRRVRLYDGVTDLLARLRASGRRTALLSNKRVEFCERILRHTGARGFFEEVFGGDSTEWLKPDGRALLRVVERLGAPSSLYVGDSSIDIACAKEAGIPVAFVSSGYGRIQGIEPDYVWDRVTRMAEVFEI